MARALRERAPVRGRRPSPGLLFALPGLLFLLAVLGFPLAYAALLAFSRFTLIRPRLLPLSGLDNFARLLADPYFWNAAWRTLGYTAATVAGEFALGLAVALALNALARGKALYLAVLTLPLAMAPVAVGLVWRTLLQPELGIVNQLLAAAGLPGPNWLGAPGLAFWTVVFVDVWQQVSFVILVMAAGLAALPREPFEAAMVDGAGAWARFVHLTWPLLRPVSLVAVTIQLINEIRTYDLVYVLTKGGPGVSTELLSFFAYKKAFLNLGLNQGAAAALLLSLLALGLTLLLFRLTGARR